MALVVAVLCLVVIGLELTLVFGRRRSGNAMDVIELRRRLSAVQDEVAKLRAAHRQRLDRLEAEQGRAGERVGSLVAQINDRLVPEVNERLAARERLAAELAEVRAHLARRLAQDAAESLGADPVDVVAGALVGGAGLLEPYRELVARYGLRVELAVPGDGGVRVYLSGRSPRALERDFFELVASGDVRDLLREPGGLQIGPLIAVRASGSVVCGVLSLAELCRGDRLTADLEGVANRLRELPDTRFREVSLSR